MGVEAFGRAEEHRWLWGLFIVFAQNFLPWVSLVLFQLAVFFLPFYVECLVDLLLNIAAYLQQHRIRFPFLRIRVLLILARIIILRLIPEPALRRNYASPRLHVLQYKDAIIRKSIHKKTLSLQWYERSSIQRALLERACLLILFHLRVG